MKKIIMLNMSREDGINMLVNEVAEAEKDKKNYRTIAYLVTGSRSEILEELNKINNEVKSIRSVYQPDDWFAFEDEVMRGDIHKFYHDELWSVGYYFGSEESKTVIENVIDAINRYAPDGEYTIINMKGDENSHASI